MGDSALYFGQLRPFGANPMGDIPSRASATGRIVNFDRGPLRPNSGMGAFFGITASPTHSPDGRHRRSDMGYVIEGDRYAAASRLRNISPRTATLGKAGPPAGVRAGWRRNPPFCVTGVSGGPQYFLRRVESRPRRSSRAKPSIYTGLVVDSGNWQSESTAMRPRIPRAVWRHAPLKIPERSSRRLSMEEQPAT